MFKKYFVYIVIAIILVIIVTIFGTSRYYKSAEQKLKSIYNTEIAADAVTIAKLHTENTVYYSKVKDDSLTISKKDIEIAKLKTQSIAINNELAIAKDAIKNYTNGQAIKYFVNYSKATDTKMLVQGTDTSVIVSSPSIRKVDDIFAEHNSFGLQIINLNQTITNQDELIVTYKDQTTQYKNLLDNKDKELSTQKQSCIVQKQVIQLDADKYKMQRNKARWLIAAPVTIAAVAILVKVFVLK